jgi:hypothetical protein
MICGNQQCVVVHGTAMLATGAPDWLYKNTNLHLTVGFHDAGVGGSSPPIATINTLKINELCICCFSYRCVEQIVPAKVICPCREPCDKVTDRVMQLDRIRWLSVQRSRDNPVCGAAQQFHLE